ncbi:MAG: rRNA pseudouridine synthase [Candidatus Omnitrophica bacterium]|nr:rRNA pseudouridine synthase [Candidatus Omnitrophota bacterium]
MRIARALALAGIDSRRKCEEHVLNGAVSVNGEVIHDLGRQVDPENDAILFRSRPLEFKKYVYYVVNKPEGYITTASDPKAKKTVYDLLPRELVKGTHQSHQNRTRVFPVGRLDKDSMGLLLFTNHGDLANQLTHPRYGVGKWYEVRLHRPFDFKDKSRLLKGVRLREGHARVEGVQAKSRRIVRVLMKEGKNREVRRIFEAFEYKVVRLIRLTLGPLSLGLMPPGYGRYLTKKEIDDLKKAAAGPVSKKGTV